MNIEKSIEVAKTPGKQVCPVCGEELFAPMDKLSISLYGKCSEHLEDDSLEQQNLFKIVEAGL